MEDYVGSYYLDNQGNIFAYIVGVFPIFFYSILSLNYCRKNAKHNYLLRYESFLIIGLLYFTMSCAVFLFYRLVHFYIIYFILFYVEFLLGFSTAGTKGLKPQVVTSVVLFSMFFVMLFYKYNSVIDKGVKVWDKYHPYSSIFDRTINSKREAAYTFLLVPDMSYEDY